MNAGFSKNPIALAVAAAISATALSALPTVAVAAKVPGKYVAGDIHNHTTCSDGAISMQKLVKKSTDTVDTPWGLDWFVQAGHGGNGNRNCTLVEDASLATPAYPVRFAPPPAAPNTIQGPGTSWTASGATLKGLPNGANMWRWQAVQEYQYPLIEYLNAQKNVPLFLGIETVNPGHEHTSMSVITGQIPASLETTPLPTTPGYTALGNATALAMWEYCFDRNDGDTSRGNTTVGGGTGNNWDCSVPGSANSADPNWNATARKLMPSGGTAAHLKSVEAVKWMAQFHPQASYFLPTHLERAGPFNTAGNNGFNVEHLRNFNNAAPTAAFGFETQPGHHASGQRGEYTVRRNGGFPGETTNVDSVGGTTYGGTGVYGAVVGGVWDALLGEGRNYWFFGSSDWHARGSFGADDRRSTNDFYPGEYQRSYSLVRGPGKLKPQAIVDGMRSGNAWVTTGQIVDRLAFVACVSYPVPAPRSVASVETLALNAAVNNADTDVAGCATMGEKLKVRPGGDIIVSIAVRDPAGTNYSPYTFANPSLAQIGVSQPLNAPVLDHIDVIQGLVTGYRTPGTPEYSGEWPRNLNWLRADGTTAPLSVVPAAAKNTSAVVAKTFNGANWTAVMGSDGTQYLKMSFKIPAVRASQYVRFRGTNLPPAVPYETDADGNPLADIFTNGVDPNMTRIPCVPAHSAGSQFDGCPDHMPTATTVTPPSATPVNPIAGQKAVAFDVAAWADLWVYSNPIYVEVAGSTLVAGVQ